jgi:hypothetical protein
VLRLVTQGKECDKHHKRDTVSLKVYRSDTSCLEDDGKVTLGRGDKSNSLQEGYILSTGS